MTENLYPEAKAIVQSMALKKSLKRNPNWQGLREENNTKKVLNILVMLLF